MSSRKLSRELSKGEEQEYQSLPLSDGFPGGLTYLDRSGNTAQRCIGNGERSSWRERYWPISCGGG